MRIREGSARVKTKHEVIEVGRATGNMLQSYLLAYEEFHSTLFQLVKRKYHCVVLSHIISPFVPFLVRDVPIVFDYKDVYSESAAAPFSFPLRPLVRWNGRLFENMLFRWPMTVVVPTPSIQALMRQRFGIESLVITNGANTELFRPSSEEQRVAVRSQLGIGPDDFSLCYLGSIENWLDLETVIAAMEFSKRAKLILVGGSVRSPEYMKSILALCEKKLKGRVLATGFQGQSRAAEIVSACDAAVIPFRIETELSRMALPDKLFEYLATGVPVVATRLPDVVTMFRDHVHFYDDSAGLAEILKTLANGVENRSRFAVANLMKEFDWKAISRRYQQLIISIIKGQTKPNSFQAAAK